MLGVAGASAVQSVVEVSHNVSETSRSQCSTEGSLVVRLLNPKRVMRRLVSKIVSLPSGQTGHLAPKLVTEVRASVRSSSKLQLLAPASAQINGVQNVCSTSHATQVNV